METIEELHLYLNAATQSGVWGQLPSRGTAWSLMRINGNLPDDAPSLGEMIETDLTEHAFAVLRAAMRLRALEGSTPLSNKAFYRAGMSFEALIHNANSNEKNLCFRRTLAAAAYHLAGYSAAAYSLFNRPFTDLNFTPGEMAIMLLILRNFDRLRSYVQEWLSNEAISDNVIAASFGGDEADIDQGLALILNNAICRALAYFDFALQTGETELIAATRELLETAGRLADNAGNVPLWWITMICRHLIDDLWQHLLHHNIPVNPPEGGADHYFKLRELFIGSLYARKIAEVELWPSQREAAARSSDLADDLIVSLPTSAGKTRIAEIAALMTLSTERRVLIVTPLRALSAQTERSFRHTFTPLGFSVSSLYGASGVSARDEDTLRSCEIVIATPEKLDFALRNDPSLINDVGLIILDEGHMIGPSEREIRFETLVQRLIRRQDAEGRRIVCLSAILPSGTELDDLTAWIRSDQPGDSVHSDWRPTRQRYGMLTWQSSGSARLTLDLNSNVPFINGFVVEKAPRKPDRNPYPRKASHLALFAAWEFAAEGKRTLIFCTQANWVEGYGKQICFFVKKGYLDTLLDDETHIARALEVGVEWLGSEHPAVSCLKIGVAIHHGRLPNPFLRELELLLAKGVLKVIVASPTLSQGLNLNAAVLLVPALVRSGKPISGEEFANVAGRAGRAFVDVEGLIVHVMFDRIAYRRSEWRKLVQSSKARTLKSGLIQIVAEILERLSREGIFEREDVWEYLANAREAWQSEVDGEFEQVALPDNEATVQGDTESDDDDVDSVDDESDETIEEEPLFQLVERLDTTVFGLIEALDADRADLPILIDQALTGSLWARQILREGEETEKAHRLILEARANLIWSETTPQARRGHFAMGVGLEAGLKIDAMAKELGELADQADMASLSGDVDKLASSLVGLADRLLVMRPFIPDKRNVLPADWRKILKQWVSGTIVSEFGAHNMRVIEEAFTYRLVWALEAIRTRRVSLGWSPDIVAGGGAATLETGVPRFTMAMLIRAGLPSRRAAIAAVESTEPFFLTIAEMREWLESNEIATLTDQEDWPTPETSALWKRFRTEALAGVDQRWYSLRLRRLLDIEDDGILSDGFYRIVPNAAGDGRTWLVTPDYQPVAPFLKAIRDQKPSLLSGCVVNGSKEVKIMRIGRGKISWPHR